MEQKYKIALSGNILNNSMEETVESLSSIISEKQPSEIEQLIQNKATIKRAVDLELANKIKSRIEQAGAECIISLDVLDAVTQQNVLPVKEALDEPETSDLSTNKTEGIVFISTAIILILTFLFISDGYEPRLGLLWSINEKMEIYSGHPFGCPEIVYAKGNIETTYGFLPTPVSGGCSEALHIKLKTKYFLLGALLMLAFGIGRYLGNFKSPKDYWRGIRQRFTQE